MDTVAIDTCGVPGQPSTFVLGNQALTLIQVRL